MRPFAFNLLLLLQRTDEALRAERSKWRPDTDAVGLLWRRRRALTERLRRSFASPLSTGI